MSPERKNLCFFIRAVPSGKIRAGYKNPDCIVFKQTRSTGRGKGEQKE